MPDQDRVVLRTATVEDRVNAGQTALDAKGLKATERPPVWFVRYAVQATS